MNRNVLAFLAMLLLVAFGTVTGVARSASSRDQTEAAARAQSPFAAFVTGPQSGVPGPKAADTPADATQHFVEKVNYPVGAGTGGGDMPEIEPNDVHTLANVSHDVPFNCTGAISFAGDWDWTAVSVSAGQPLQVNVFSALAGGMLSPLDPYLSVWAQDGSPIASNDDISFPMNLNSQVNFVAPYNGMVYFAVRSAVSVGGPSYQYVLSVLVVPGNAYDLPNWEVEPNDSPAMADPITASGVKLGAITYPGDVDYTYLDAPAGATVVIDVSAHVYGFDVDPILRLFDSAGHLLFVSDDVDGLDPRFNVVVPASGRYFLSVSDYHGVGGFFHSYIVNVTLQDGAASPFVTKLKLAPNANLKKVMGHNFIPGGSAVELNGVIIPTVASAPKPTTVIKVKPTVAVTSGFVVTVVNGNGRRSNPARVD